jgi:hypothetical protein
MKIRDQSNQTIKKKLQEMIFIMCCNFFFIINVGVRTSLRVPQLISYTLKVNDHVSFQWPLY